MGKILVVEFLFSFSDVYISWNIFFIKRLLESCYWTPGGSRKVPINSCQYFRPSVYPFVCPSTLLSVLSVWTFSWNFIIRFFKFWHGGGNRYEVVPYRVGISGRFLNLLENLVINFYWICFTTKTYVICYSAQIPYLEKNFFLRYGSKYSQLIRLQVFLMNHISRTNQWNSLIFCILIQVHVN